MRAIAVCVLLLLQASTARAQGSSAEARAHYEKGIALYQAEDYEAAIVEFRAAFRLERSVEYVFAWAQAKRLSGDCKSALEVYRRALDLDPPPEEIERITKVGIEPCERELGNRGPGEDQTDPPPPVDTGPKEDPLIVKAVGPALAGVSGLFLVTGIGYHVAALSSRFAATGADEYQEFEDKRDEFRSRRSTGNVMLSFGVVFAAGWATYTYWPWRDDDTDTVVTISPGGVTVMGRF